MSDMLPAGPFVHWIRTCGLTNEQLRRAGLDPSYRARLLDGTATEVGEVLVDRVLSRCEWPLELVYPYEGELDADVQDPPLPHTRRYARKLPDRITRDYEDGDSIQVIADRYGATKPSVHAALVKAGVPLRPQGGRHKPGSKALRLAVRQGGWEVVAIRADQLQREGMSYRQIATRLGYASGSSVHGAVKRLRAAGSPADAESNREEER